ncbi:Cysteine-rich RLK (receptor-like protein kinase) 8 [Cucumis melo var. makuwa]|uniref:Cysteine-rich RLK (Receptor-like protein kinase) 8 n=1 Tax=Cucumis melo var. makuwa TaxID=1194695 RepID=A0A5D3D767_CUCMM|nr:Cysteine-rich RLK (receptor-like protein kinase) 8 [Cucumis melo var. makuwa]
MVSEQSNNETLENNLEETQIETEPVTVVVAAAVDAAVVVATEKLLHNLQKPPIYPTGVVSQPYAPLSDQKMIHASLMSGAWAHVSPPFHVTAQPVPFYAPSDVQPSNSSGHPHPHAPPMSFVQQPSTVNLSNLYSKQPLYVDSLQQPLFSGNEIDQPQNKSDIEADESLMHSKPTELPMYFKNPMFLEGRHQFDFLTGETVRPSPGDALERLWKGEDSLIRSMLINRGKKRSSNEKQNSGRAYISETTPTSTSQSTDPTASQTKTPTLGVITQSGMPQSLRLISVDGKNPWILDSGATDHLTAAHLISRMSSRILHLQNPLDCLKESYPSTRLVSEACVFVGYPLHQRGYKYFHPPSKKYFVTMDITFCENRPYFPVSHLQGENVSEESNSTFEFVEPTPITVSDIDPYPIILPTNQVPWKTYYRRNLRKEVGSPTSQLPAPVQDFEPPRDQGMENPTKPCTNNTMSENDKSDVVVFENMEKKNRDDETEVRIETSTRSCTKHPICNYVSYDNLSPQFRAFTASLDSTIIPKRHKTVGCKWVFFLKYRADGTLDRQKARVLLSVAMNKDWPLYQLDVKNAFLNRDLVEEVDMSPRQDLKPNLISRFTTFVKSQAYSQGHSDHNLFTKASKTRKIAILIVYVDDIVLTGDDQTEISQLKQRMGMLGCRCADTPIEFNSKLNFDDQVPIDKEQYQRLAPYEKHMEAVNRILRYLKNTPGKRLMFRKTNRKTIEAYTDSDWAGSVIDRKSTSGYCTFAWGNLVTSRSKKQSAMARSSAEVEYKAMSLGICDEV